METKYMVDPLSVIATGMAVIAISWQIIQWRIERRAWAVPTLSCSMHDYEGKKYAVVDSIVTNKGISNLHLAEVALFSFKGKSSTSNMGLPTIGFPTSADLAKKGFDFFIKEAEWYDTIPEFTEADTFLGKDETWSHHRLIPITEKGFYKIFLYVATKSEIWISAEKVMYIE